MDPKLYLQRINIHTPDPPSVEALRKLHYQHLLTVPFENLSFHCGKRITLDVATAYEKIVLRKRGGVCYESNGLLLRVLQDLGYNAVMLAAQVQSNIPGLFGPPSHMVLMVQLEGRRWLCDVGFVEGIIFPIPLKAEWEEKQDNRVFRLRVEEEEWYLESKRGKSWRSLYKFNLKVRMVEDFKEMCEYHQTSPSSICFCKSICSLLLPQGRLSFIGRKLIIKKYTAGGGTLKTTRDLTDTEIPEVLKVMFGVVLSGKLVPKDEDPAPLIQD
ncbi:hypothetical protein GDO86_009293 [Hymenochirus boettgeri]|uniref:arylamine N-acetyltransferase n=1 Tax=Hymenochirus boettgeri TaxID=247094 RepID=A0A8T2JKI7_9PIPI|nr:hypothetical protein GDO86_009293 [Hymenochirus boettgeri]